MCVQVFRSYAKGKEQSENRTLKQSLVSAAAMAEAVAAAKITPHTVCVVQHCNKQKTYTNTMASHTDSAITKQPHSRHTHTHSRMQSNLQRGNACLGIFIRDCVCVCVCACVRACACACVGNAFNIVTIALKAAALRRRRRHQQLLSTPHAACALCPPF